MTPGIFSFQCVENDRIPVLTTDSIVHNMILYFTFTVLLSFLLSLHDDTTTNILCLTKGVGGFSTENLFNKNMHQQSMVQTTCGVNQSIL